MAIQRRRPPSIIVAGPTASGKSALALELAAAFGGTIINADALQSYRDLRILTARPDAAAEARVPHRLYGFLDAAERGSAAQLAWAGARRDRRGDPSPGGCRSSSAAPGSICGRCSTAWRRSPPIPATIRDEAAALYRALGGAAFRERLAALDPRPRRACRRATGSA